MSKKKASEQTEEQPVEDTSVFDEAEVSEELPTQDENAPDEEQESFEEWAPTVSKESPKEMLERKGNKEKADGRILTIKSVGFTRPKTTKANGEPLPPSSVEGSDSEWYSGKLKIHFEEDNLVEYYPSFSYFINDGVISKHAKINRKTEKPLKKRNKVHQLLHLACEKMGKPMEEVSDQEFYDWLVGKKVKIETEEDVYQGKSWFRNDIVEFVD